MKLYKYLLLLPLFMVLLSIPLENHTISISKGLKLAALILVLFNVLYTKQTGIYIYMLLVVIVYLIALTIYNNIQLRPALEDGIRYLIPIMALIYGWQLKSHRDLVLNLLIGYVLLNDFYQLVNGVLQMIWLQEIVFYRATGFVSFFDFFGFINLVGLVCLNELNNSTFNKHKRVLNIIFVVFILWSLSLKVVVLLFVYGLFRSRKILIIPLILSIPLCFTKNQGVVNGLWLRINRYLINRASARNESYRVAFNNLGDFWLIGKGPGTFGGPASTKYNSVLYQHYNFNWFGDLGLNTTDTYYPHLIIELGLVFSILYLILIFGYPIIISKNKPFTSTIVLILAFNSIFSFALNSINYCFFILILVYFCGIDQKKSNKSGLSV